MSFSDKEFNEWIEELFKVKPVDHKDLRERRFQAKKRELDKHRKRLKKIIRKRTAGNLKARKSMIQRIKDWYGRELFKLKKGE